MRTTSFAIIGAALAIGFCCLPADSQRRVVRQNPAASIPDLKGQENMKFDLSPLETRVLGTHNWLSGGPASLRVIVSDHQTGKPLHADVALSLEKLENGKPVAPAHTLFSGKTNVVGSVDAAFTAPKTAPGAYQLTVSVKTPIGADTITQPIQIQDSSQLLLTVDKPLYQPGQVMHLRAMALDMATRHALADKPVTFEVEDARGNKVFKKRDTLSKFGISSADFVLADEVNMGLFTVRAILPEGQTEKKVRVARYVLPKFKVSLTTNKPYYLPGEEVQGTLKANYFFGKAVADGTVTIEINTIDIGVTKLTELKGTTSPIGAYTFRYTLPKSFVGQPFEQGKAVVEFHATLKDTADHKQETNLTVPVVKEPVLLVVVPESRSLVPDVENRVYIAAATADGSPLKQIKLDVSRTTTVAKQPVVTTITTDDLGLATYSMTPGKDPVTLTVKAVDANGHAASVTQQLQAAPSQDAILLRSDKTIAKVGDRLNLAMLSSVKGGTVYLDVIRNKQTILTHAQPMMRGEAHLSLPVSSDMVGTLELHAYKILPNEDIIRDTRTFIISPADDLNIKVAADKVEYKPGGEAMLKFSVSDQHGRPTQAAIGLAIVDESVFALSELQPGLEKIYFMLEKELMEPKYEIHGLTPTGLFQPGPIPLRDNERQRAAALILAAVPARTEFEFRVNTYQQRWAAVQMKVVALMQQKHQKIMNAIQKYRGDTKSSLSEADTLTLLVKKGYLQEADLIDPWGNFYKTNLNGAKNYDGYFTISSAGPDGKWDTLDDVKEVSLYGWNGNGIRTRGRFAGRGGGVGGGVFGEKGGIADFGDAFALGAVEGPVFDMAAPAGAVRMMKQDMTKDRKSEKPQAGGEGGGAVRVREYFPETMLWNPALITDEQGHATLNVPIADSITTWRVSMMANSVMGQLGSATSPIKVFQDFFVDIDLPVSLTQNDHMEIPVAVYNYMPVAQDVTLTLTKEAWFTLTGDAKQTLRVEPGQVKVIHYPIVVNAIGKHALTVTAKGSKLSDAVRRQIEVTPDGKEVLTTINDRLEGKADKSLNIPVNAVQGANTIFVKLYPGTFSQVVEGLDGILRMPNGCFEQTSSTTYPNILVLDYLKKTKHINPELQLKAEQYINIGYQRLVTFECKSGGFSWFGNEPAHQILTAYGLLEFGDMAKVHEVDPAVISRTQNWLASQQKPDGTWEEKNQGIAEGIINRQTGALRLTAYIAWALAESGYQGPQVAKGVSYVKEHLNEAADPYTLAVILNLLAKVDRDGQMTAQAADKLIALATTTDKTAFWQGDTRTFTGANGRGADLETTGMAAYGLVKWGRNAGFLNKVLTYIVQSKDSFGTWESTQGTVWSMKSLLYASTNGTGESKGTVTVLANGQKAATFKITPEDSDVMRQVNLAESVRPGDNNISLQYDGNGSLLYQIVGRHYLPWKQAPLALPGAEPLSIKVEYDKTTLAQDDTATVTVTIHNKTDKTAEMPLIDVGVPPGFSVIPDALASAVENKKISKFTVAARQVIVYLEQLTPGQTVVLSYQVRAKFPIKAKTPLSKVYPYYNPEKVAFSAPQDIVVK